MLPCDDKNRCQRCRNLLQVGVAYSALAVYKANRKMPHMQASAQQLGQRFTEVNVTLVLLRGSRQKTHGLRRIETKAVGIVRNRPFDEHACQEISAEAEDPSPRRPADDDAIGIARADDDVRLCPKQSQALSNSPRFV